MLGVLVGGIFALEERFEEGVILRGNVLWLEGLLSFCFCLGERCIDRMLIIDKVIEGLCRRELVVIIGITFAEGRVDLCDGDVFLGDVDDRLIEKDGGEVRLVDPM